MRRIVILNVLTDRILVVTARDESRFSCRGEGDEDRPEPETPCLLRFEVLSAEVKSVASSAVDVL
jgi:hypothetical protein